MLQEVFKAVALVLDMGADKRYVLTGAETLSECEAKESNLVRLEDMLHATFGVHLELSLELTLQEIVEQIMLQKVFVAVGDALGVGWDGMLGTLNLSRCGADKDSIEHLTAHLNKEFNVKLEITLESTLEEIAKMIFE